jgi:hypothetical protein
MKPKTAGSTFYWYKLGFMVAFMLIGVILLFVRWTPMSERLDAADNKKKSSTTTAGTTATARNGGPGVSTTTTATPTTNNNPCTPPDDHVIYGEAKVVVDPLLLRNKDAGKLHVHTDGLMTVVLKSGSYPFGGNTPEPPFKISDLQEGFIAKGTGTISVTRCKR